MDYKAIKARADAGIRFFSDSDGESAYRLIISGGGKYIDENGDQQTLPPQEAFLTGLVRDVSIRDVNGDSIRSGDKRGIFGGDQLIDVGMIIYVDGIQYRVTDPRPVKPTGTVVAYRPILRRVAIANG
ncbi:MAG: hypothetical protein [Bacteriophage sp.]|jgi:hypothetical protein|nr:MAG: hypothetical protein [Bacteriophage sp.]